MGLGALHRARCQQRIVVVLFFLFFLYMPEHSLFADPFVIWLFGLRGGSRLLQNLIVTALKVSVAWHLHPLPTSFTSSQLYLHYTTTSAAMTTYWLNTSALPGKLMLSESQEVSGPSVQPSLTLLAWSVVHREWVVSHTVSTCSSLNLIMNTFLLYLVSVH